jgi:hypothetical protein
VQLLTLFQLRNPSIVNALPPNHPIGYLAKIKPGKQEDTSLTLEYSNQSNILYQDD